MTRTITIAILALLFAGCHTASAGWPHDAFDTWHNPPRKHVHRHHKPKVIYKRAPVVVMTPGTLQDAPRCQPAFRTVGDQGPTFSVARAQAEKAWSQQARFSYGERYGDPANARSVTFECIKSGTGTVVGDWFNRCEMRATPCQAPQVGPGK